MNDDLRLSLFLDGRLPAGDAAVFEARLAAEPALRARLDAMRRLQVLSAGLRPASAAFSGDDVRVRAEFRPRGGWRRLGLAAAAVLALTATHAAVFHLGARRGSEAERAERASIEQAAALLERAAEIDFAAPPDQLEGELDAFRREIPTRLVALSRARQPEAVQYADTLRQIDFVIGEQRDPGFAGIEVSLIARSSLGGGEQVRLVPATATEYSRVVPVGGGRYQLIFIENVNGAPRMVTDVGTPEELEARCGIRVAAKRPERR